MICALVKREPCLLLADCQTLSPTVQEALDACDGREALSIDRHRLELLVRAKLASWRELLTRHVQAGRALLREILVGPIQFTPLERAPQRGHAFRGEVSLSTLLDG